MSLTKKLFDRTLTGDRKKPIEVCYVPIYSIFNPLSEKTVKEIITNLQQTEQTRNSLLDNQIAFDTEEKAENYAQSELIDWEKKSPGSYANHFAKSNDIKDLPDNAYWIITMRGDQDIVNKLLKETPYTDAEILKRILYVRSVSGKINITREECLAESEKEQKHSSHGI